MALWKMLETENVQRKSSGKEGSDKKIQRTTQELSDQEWEEWAKEGRNIDERTWKVKSVG